MTRNTSFIELMEAVEGSQRLGNVHYWDGYGFHFYAMLRPRLRGIMAPNAVFWNIKAG